MKKSLEELLEIAKLQKEIFNDDKTSCSYKDLLDLLNDGAKIFRFNVKEIGGNYVIEAVYKGYIFQAVSDKQFYTLNSCFGINFSRN